LALWFIQMLSMKGDLVVDPFGGSFVVGAAAQLTGRRFVGGDINPEHVAAGRFRIAQIGIEEMAYGRERPLSPELLNLLDRPA
jgi:DNA modification methylase